MSRFDYISYFCKCRMFANKYGVWSIIETASLRSVWRGEHILISFSCLSLCVCVGVGLAIRRVDLYVFKHARGVEPIIAATCFLSSGYLCCGDRKQVLV